MTEAATPGRGRLGRLDALRGVAAVVVLVHHVSMTVPQIAAAYESSAGVTVYSVGWWATLSPLKVLLAGPEFVLVFFVLSGLVLVRSPLVARRNGARYDWVAYYVRRVIRLAVPVLVSVGLAVIWIVLVPRMVGAEGGPWLARQDTPDLGLDNLLREASIIGETRRPDINPPLWSLVWEMWFSLLLPVFVALAAFTRSLVGAPVRRVLLWAAFWCALASLGYVTTTQPLMYLPPFALGALLAANFDELQRCSDRLVERAGGRLLGWALATLGSLLLVAYWMLRPLTSGAWSDVTLSLRVAGAFVIVATVAFWPAAQRVRDQWPRQLLTWLGSISFSLYLVHFPIVVAFALLAGPGRWWLGALASVPLSLLMAQAMTRWVERPAQVYGTRAGASVSQRMSRLEQRK
ncbi:acyltransferase family protein [Cryobacterium aureum]|uniref:acyltransferase family protein n=1 Tax=Cryobacterium aureum TaxID=995037 RepID=UPI001374E677|nr:acyltransferase [Cryobacterium aureum]